MDALVIDDSRAMRTILGGMLTDLGFRVVQATDGRDALARLAETPAARLALVDWNMPEMDGLAFIRAVRADRAYEGLKLVVVSTETEQAQMATALEAGADEYVMKPFTRAVIAEKLGLLGLAGPSA